MTYTLGQAAKATGRNKATIFQAIKSGRISAAKDDLGRYMIDPAELHRLYPPVSSNGETSEAAQRGRTPDNGVETQLLRDKIALLERLVEQITGDRDRLLLLLPKPSDAPPVIVATPQTETAVVEITQEPDAQEITPAPAPNRGSFFGRIFGRAAA
jgi:hypothetical protein